MEQNPIKVIMLYLVIIAIGLSFTSCGSTNLINDFFGIQMNPLQEKYFKIISYNEFDGVKYQSTAKMEPSVNAWAELSVDEVRIKIVNTTPRSIPLNYNLDQYIIITDEKEYVLEKGDRFSYFAKKEIEPNSNIELRLKLPNDYVLDAQERIRYNDATDLTKHMLQEYSKMGKNLNVQKDNIKYIIIKLSDRTIVLKKVPGDQ